MTKKQSIKRPDTVKSLCECIWWLEEQYDLFNLEIDGVKVWQSARMQIYYHIAEKLEILSKPQAVMSRMQKWKVLTGYLKNALMNHPFGTSSVDCIVFPHPRTKRVDGREIDIYTDDIVQQLLNEQKSVIEIETPYKGKHQRESRVQTYYDDLLILIRQFARFVPLSNVPHETISQITEAMKDKYCIEIDFQHILSMEAKRFKLEYKYYKELFQKINPKTLYLTVSYGKSALICAAKEAGILTIEMQHGTYSCYHLGYSFPIGKRSLSYFPDHFYVWSDFWCNLIDLPLSKEYVLNHGFAYMEKEKKKLSKIKKEDDQVLVLSQGVIGEKIARILLKNIDTFQGYRIKYKLHPGEYESWQSYPSLKALLAYENIELIKECDLYTLMAQSRYQIGVFSTAIYEGISFECVTILLDLPGIEYMEDLLKKNIVMQYREGESLESYR